MSVAKVIELNATSEESFEDAIQQGVRRATKTLKNVQGAWVKEQRVLIEDGEVSGYQVNLLVTFVLNDGDDDADEDEEDEEVEEEEKPTLRSPPRSRR